MLAADAIVLRPQPVGLHPGAGGLLLLPPADAPDTLAAILAGAMLERPAALSVPPEWQAWKAAISDAESPAVIDEDPHDALAAYNAFVRTPVPARYELLQRYLAGPLRELLDVAAYACGVLDEPPADTPTLDGELLALARATRAAWHLEHGEPDDAITCLTEAVEACRAVVPVLAAQLLAQRAGLHEALALTAADLREAIRLARDCQSPDLVAGLWSELGLAYQERGGGARGALAEAVKAYHEAIHAGFTAERRPQEFGWLQNHIGLAYLSMPMTEASDQLRMAVAVQSFREATRMFSREQHPELWASTQMNLANALQYLPSSHPAENLAKAVEIYETLLEVRDRERDPIGYARVLANQGNALAHLGGVVVALGKLREARTLAIAGGAGDLVDSLTAQIDQLEAHRLRPADVAPQTAEVSG